MKHHASKSSLRAYSLSNLAILNGANTIAKSHSRPKTRLGCAIIAMPLPAYLFPFFLITILKNLDYFVRK